MTDAMPETYRTPYWSYSIVQVYLLIAWLLTAALSLAVLKQGIEPAESTLGLLHHILKFLYPALGIELDELPQPPFSRARPQTVAIPFAIQTLSLYVTSAVHCVLIHPKLRYMRSDKTSIIVLCAFSAAVLFGVADLTTSYRNLYNDPIDTNGIFIIKRTLETAWISYAFVVLICNALLRLKTLQSR